MPHEKNGSRYFNSRKCIFRDISEWRWAQLAQKQFLIGMQFIFNDSYFSIHIFFLSHDCSSWTPTMHSDVISNLCRKNSWAHHHHHHSQAVQHVVDILDITHPFLAATNPEQWICCVQLAPTLSAGQFYATLTLEIITFFAKTKQQKIRRLNFRNLSFSIC